MGGCDRVQAVGCQHEERRALQERRVFIGGEKPGFHTIEELAAPPVLATSLCKEFASCWPPPARHAKKTRVVGQNAKESRVVDPNAKKSGVVGAQRTNNSGFLCKPHAPDQQLAISLQLSCTEPKSSHYSCGPRSRGHGKTAPSFSLRATPPPTKTGPPRETRRPGKCFLSAGEKGITPCSGGRRQRRRRCRG